MRTRNASLLIALVALTISPLGSAVAGEPTDIVIDFYLEMHAGDTNAFVVVEEDAPVTAVEVRSSNCAFGPGTILDPGEWIVPTDGFDCADLTARIHLDGEVGDQVPNHGEQACGAFIGIHSVVMSGGSYTDSYDGSDPAGYDPATAGDEGDVCTNGTLKLNGHATIHGDAMFAEAFRASGKAAVTGTADYLDEPLVLGAVDPSAAAASNDNHTIPFTSRGRYPMDSDGGFSISSDDEVDLAPGTYYFSELTLTGHSKLGITGPTTIYVTGQIKVTGHSTVNAGGVPADLQLLSTGHKLVLSGHSELFARVLAPEARISRTGGSHFFGTLAGQTLKSSGNGALHTDGAVQATSAGNYFEIEMADGDPDPGPTVQ